MTTLGSSMRTLSGGGPLSQLAASELNENRANPTRATRHNLVRFRDAHQRLER
jgi:hypothetical protein